jgi:hypothetical protein
MRALLVMSTLMACHSPIVRHCDDCGGGMQPAPPMPKISVNDLDVAFDLDQLFVNIKHDVPTSFDAPATGPLAEIDHVDVLADGAKLITTITHGDATAFQYKAEPFADVAQDQGATSGTREHLKLMLGAAVGDYVKSAHPFKLVLRGVSAAGALVIETSFTGDQASKSPAPRPD